MTVSPNDAAAGGEHTKAFRSGVAHARFWLVGVAALWLDLWSKKWIFANLTPAESRPFIDDVINFHRSLNDGAVFGSFTGQVGLFIVASVFAFVFVFYLFAASDCRHWLLHLALGLILAGALGNLYDRAVIKADIVVHDKGSGATERVIGRILNEPDDDVVRIGSYPEGSHPREFKRDDVTVRRQGVVRDFIKFVPAFPTWVPKLGGKDVWPWVFNVADAALVCGVGILLCTSWSFRRREEKS